MINNVIVIAALLVISFFYLRERYEAAAVATTVLSIMAPTLKIGEGSFNAAYLMTLWLLSLFVIDHVKKKTWPSIEKGPVRTMLILFIVSRFITITAYLIGYLQHGTAALPTIFGALAGNINLSVLVVCIAYILTKVERKRLVPIIYQSAAIVAGVNLVFYVLQRFFFDIGFSWTYALYMSPDRIAPLENMREIGAFDRIFGSFFTPTLMGTTFLYLIVLLLAWYFASRQEHHVWPILTVVSVLTFIGINSFSKVLILGIPAILLLSIPCLFILNRSKLVKPNLTRYFFLVTAAIALVFTFTYFVFPAELINVKNYYYGMILEPLNSLTTRYQIPENINPGVIEAGEEIPDAGMTVSALMFFRQHPIFGVGPVAVGEEFIGDSQIIMALHHGGIIGTLGYLIFYVTAFIKTIQKRNLMGFLLIAAIFISCAATVTLDYRQTMPFVAMLILIVTGSDHEFGPVPGKEKLGWFGQTLSLDSRGLDQQKEG